MNPFPQNLSILRRAAGYTQEGLAEALGVSRQAVGKWESGQALPEAGTLLALADLLNCSLDVLMREALSEADAPEQAVDQTARDYDLFLEYDAHMDRFSAAIAGGVALILAAVGGVCIADALRLPEYIGVSALLLCVAAAVFLFVRAGMSYADFQRCHPAVPDCYLPEEREQFGRRFRTGLPLAIAGILIGVAVMAGGGALFQGDATMEGLCAGGFLWILAVSVGAIVRLGILSDKYDLEKYAREAQKAARER